ncbi:hypothetical protein SAMN05421827_102116 [Pedobacter terrae]|uniref:Uncharacterized protein n=1 Tax=Pedobacter terrae TaxID=405671 RepID=A0A1G7Q0E3_9SPHI|nr:hypothetical protein [Pedobacter terrae]SDF91964.1 hypothetical protein SAMN05421827_102116 [Pedobacter terrae]
MKLKPWNVMFLSLLTTLAALVSSFIYLPQNSGYAGLFFITISPIAFFMFVIWTLILVPVTEKKEGFIKLLITFLSTVVLQYLAMIIANWILSSDDRYYDLGTFFTDCGNLLGDIGILLCTLAVATVYTLLMRSILNRK